MKKLLIMAASVLMIIGLCSCGSGNGTENKPTNADSSAVTEQATKQATEKVEEKSIYQKGETAVYKDKTEVTFEEIETTDGGQYSIIQDDEEYVLVKVKIKNKGDSKLSVSPMNFKMKNGSGVVTDADFALPSQAKDKSELKSVDLASGGEIEGWVAFTLQKDEKSLELEWYNNMFDDEPGLAFKAK